MTTIDRWDNLQYKQYIAYLAEWLRIHSDPPIYGISPARFEAWLQMEEETA